VGSTTLPKSLPFLVFATGLASVPWKITAVESDQTLSTHKSLKTALTKAECLNLVRMAMPEAVYAERETSRARAVRGSCQLWYDTAWAEADSRQCDGIGSVSDIETGMTWCLRCWRTNHA
jgi:hypothetical protein